MDKIIELKAQVFDCIVNIENNEALKKKLLNELVSLIKKEKDEQKETPQGDSVSDTAPTE